MSRKEEQEGKKATKKRFDDESADGPSWSGKCIGSARTGRYHQVINIA